MSTTENAVVEDGTGQQVLDEINELILAEVTKFSSTTEPADPEPYQNWVNLTCRRRPGWSGTPRTMPGSRSASS